MSAYLCSNATFATLAVFAHANLSASYERETVSALANLLAEENVRSVNYRYAHNPAAQEKFRKLTDGQIAKLARPMDAIAILKLCDCVEYQSCENDDYRDSLAFKALDRIRGLAITKLPGYDAAPWGI